MRLPGQALGDRVSAFFVPAVCLAAFVTWLAWFLAGAPLQAAPLPPLGTLRAAVLHV